MHIKRKGPQACDSCWRWFDADDGWDCPWCEFGNAGGSEEAARLDALAKVNHTDRERKVLAP